MFDRGRTAARATRGDSTPAGRGTAIGVALSALGALSAISAFMAVGAAQMLAGGSRDPWDYGGLALGVAVPSLAALAVLLLVRPPKTRPIPAWRTQ